LFYDADGNVTSDGTNSYVWNARNQLASMDFGALSFDYDAYGRRVGKTGFGTTTNYLYDGANIVQELVSGTPTANLLTGGIDEIFTRTDSNGTADFLRDALGSTIALADPSGSIETQYTFEPFGNVTLNGSVTTPYQYTGRENEGTGLYFYRARYYDPTLARFTSEDPAGFAGGMNLYGYVGNNPLRYADPFGLDKKSPPAAGQPQTEKCPDPGIYPFHTRGGGGGGMVAAGLGNGRVLTGSANVLSSNETPIAGAATWGPVQSATAPPHMYGAYVGGGAQFTFSNGEPGQLSGPFNVYVAAAGIMELNFGVVMACNGPVCQFSVDTPVLSSGFGAVVGAYKTNSGVITPGCKP
jgi:RHS repeat-associated protein